MIVSQFNDIDNLYDSLSIMKTQAGKYECPVCKKTYKKEHFAIEHFSKRDCYNAVDLFKGTDREKVAYSFYKKVKATDMIQKRVSLPIFRKSKVYKSCIAFTLFCDENEVKNKELYYAYVRDSRGYEHNAAVFYNAKKMTSLSDYREWLYNNPQYIDNVLFLDRNPEFMENRIFVEGESTFFIRSIQKAHLSLLYYMDVTGLSFEKVKKKLSPWHQIMLDEHRQLIKNFKNGK